MKIAVEMQPCLKNRSGIGIYTYELVKRLQYSKKIQLEGYIFNFFLRNNLTDELTGLNFQQKYCMLFPYGIYRRIWRFAPLPYRWLFGKDADITHFFNFIVPKGVAGKVVTTIHDVVWLRYPETMDARNLRRITCDIEYSINRADRIVAVSENTKLELINLLKIPNNKIVVASPGVDVEAFQKIYTLEDIQRIKAQYHLPDHYILYMGTLEPRKNIERLVQAFAQLCNRDGIEMYYLVLAGKRGWQYDAIFEKIQQLGLENRIICTDYVDEADKAAIYQLADVFAFPSLYEGFGMPVLEAMAAGLPVVTSNVSSLPEVAGDAALQVDPLNTSEIADALYKLLTDDVLRRQCINRGYVQCDKYTWERSTDILVKMYHDIMQE